MAIDWFANSPSPAPKGLRQEDMHASPGSRDAPDALRVHSRIFLHQYIRMKPCILPVCTISSCDAFHRSSCVCPASNCSLHSISKRHSTVQLLGSRTPVPCQRGSCDRRQAMLLHGTYHSLCLDWQAPNHSCHAAGCRRGRFCTSRRCVQGHVATAGEEQQAAAAVWLSWQRADCTWRLGLSATALHK